MWSHLVEDVSNVIWQSSDGVEPTTVLRGFLERNASLQWQRPLAIAETGIAQPVALQRAGGGGEKAKQLTLEPWWKVIRRQDGSIDLHEHFTRRSSTAGEQRPDLIVLAEIEIFPD